MAVPFRPRQGEISIQVEFAQPTFSLFSKILDLGHALWTHLSPLGMKLADLKFAGSEATYSDTHVTCFLYNFGAELNVRPERIEIRSYDIGKRQDAFGAIAAATTAALKVSTDVSLRSCTSVTALHADLADHSVGDFIRRYVTSAPSELGAPFGAGVVFYFEPNDGRLTSSVNLEPSASIQGGLYFRTTNVWSMDAGDLKELGRREEVAFVKTIAAFDLEPT